MGWKGNCLDGFVRAGFYLSIEDHPERQYYAGLRCSKPYSILLPIHNLHVQAARFLVAMTHCPSQQIMWAEFHQQRNIVPVVELVRSCVSIWLPENKCRYRLIRRSLHQILKRRFMYTAENIVHKVMDFVIIIYCARNQKQTAGTAAQRKIHQNATCLVLKGLAISDDGIFPADIL